MKRRGVEFDDRCHISPEVIFDFGARRVDAADGVRVIGVMRTSSRRLILASGGYSDERIWTRGGSLAPLSGLRGCDGRTHGLRRGLHSRRSADLRSQLPRHYDSNRTNKYLDRVTFTR